MKHSFDTSIEVLPIHTDWFCQLLHAIFWDTLYWYFYFIILVFIRSALLKNVINCFILQEISCFTNIYGAWCTQSKSLEISVLEDPKTTASNYGFNLTVMSECRQTSSGEFDPVKDSTSKYLWGTVWGLYNLKLS